MIYKNSKDWKNSKQKRVLLLAMSGLGKTYVSSMLRAKGDWFHYSIDYRIGTRYMGEHIVDNFKQIAMETPFLADLLRSDSLYIASNITPENLSPLSTYLGKPGDTTKGGIPFEEYRKRQTQHHSAEKSALMDTPHFIERAKQLYGYSNFVCDSGGSICEVVDPWNPKDPILNTLSKNLLLVWIKGSEEHTSELISRFDQAPKPMCYQADFLLDAWQGYQDQTGLGPNKIDPNDFIRWTYARAMAHREPRYAQMANWGITVNNAELKDVSSPEGFENVIYQAIDSKLK